ncbi:hypothetical protein CPB84DRAFT_1742458 [Gymnopilus junonius]|uniref:RRM domain-containing protein n=1 Tax=Gymnopilus junonius TaxID=109634 RepID=A0A9P5TTD5_GYMJU|nr:hypothetical protein CPB84DRAFT_1742458 [Gymnopilus junonius]
MSSIQKLTKKQKKGLAFRDRKTNKGQRKNVLVDMENNAVPLMEDQDLPSSDGGSTQVAGDEGKEKRKAKCLTEGSEGQRSDGKTGSKSKGKAEESNVPVPVESVKAGKKRKRTGDEAEQGVSNQQPDTSKRKKPNQEESGGEEDGKKSKQRYILFVGNLKYTTTLDAIEAHFSSCDPPPTVRLLTPKSKGTTGSVQKNKSKGCAFLEFTHRNALQQGLKLHQSTLDGRMINVELTAGGGGKSESRLEKVRQRNKALLGQREIRIEKDTSKDSSFPNLPSKPQRFSATSGLEQKPQTKRTWTIGDVDDGETHRGGRQHRKKSKTWGTGVNAIPVG